MKGLRAVAFTDHLEMDAFYENSFNKTAIQSFFEIAKARSAFSGKLIVCIGAELGQPTYNRPVSEKLLEMMKYDFVIGSIHNLPDMKDFYYMDFSDESIDCMKLLEEYFEQVLELAKWAKFDSLGHLTYPLRYMVGNYGKSVDISKFSEVIDEILELDYCEVDLDEGEGILICTDGLTNFVDKEAVSSVLKEHPLMECPEILVDLANKNGGGDNITVVVIQK